MSDLSPLSDAALDRLFRQARTVHAFQPVPVSDATLHQLYDLLKWAPTSANSNPARFVFVRTAGGKARLLPALSPGNVEKVRTAPVTVIVAYDLRFSRISRNWRPTRRPCATVSPRHRVWSKPPHAGTPAFRART